MSLLLWECSYEMPLETEDSYKAKLETGKIIKQEKKDENWMPDSYFEDVC